MTQGDRLCILTLPISVAANIVRVVVTVALAELGRPSADGMQPVGLIEFQATIRALVLYTAALRMLQTKRILTSPASGGGNET